EQKICSVGIAVRQWVAWHGLALNLTCDLAGFSRIRPCGFDATVMTRLADHIADCPAPASLAEELMEALVATLALPPVEVVVRARLGGAADLEGLLRRLED